MPSTAETNHQHRPPPPFVGGLPAAKSPAVVVHASIDGLPEIIRNKILLEYIGGIRDRGDVASYFETTSDRGGANDDIVGASVLGDEIELGGRNKGRSVLANVNANDHFQKMEVEGGNTSVAGGRPDANANYNAFINGMPTLIRLASTSKNWSQCIYRDMPNLWKAFNADDIFKSAKDKMTDAWLDTFLRRINAREVVHTLDLSGCDMVMGPGLEPIRGSTILRKLQLDWKKNRRGSRHEGKLLMNIIESLVPEGLARSCRPTGGPGLLLLTLPDPSNYYSNDDSSDVQKKLLRAVKDEGDASPPRKKSKKTSDECDETEGSWSYVEALRAMQKRYRRFYHDHMKTNLLCSTCDLPQMVWLSSSYLQRMGVESSCLKCLGAERETLEAKLDALDDDDDAGYDTLDLGILDRFNECCACKGRDCLDDGSPIVCGTCPLDEPHYTSICCMKTDEGNKRMHICSKCKCTSCENCHDHDHYLKEFAVQQCKSEELNGIITIVIVLLVFLCDRIQFVAHFTLLRRVSLSIRMRCQGVRIL